MGTIKEFALFNECDFQYMESYMCDKAGQGLLLTHFGMFSAEFIESEPSNRRYRIIPKINRKVRDEEISLCAESGWTYLGKKSGTGLNIFYTDNEDAPEIFTDKKSFKSYAEAYALSHVLSVIVFLWLGYLILFKHNVFVTAGGPVHTIIELGIPFCCVIASVILISIVNLIYGIWGTVRAMRRIMNSESISHDIPYKNRLKFSTVTFKATIALVIIMFVSVYIYDFVMWNFNSTNYESEYDGQHPVSMEVIDFENWQPVQEIIDNDDFGNENVDFFVDKKDNFMIEYTNIHAYANDVNYFANYCEARTEKIAEQWLIEDIYYDTDFELSAEDVAMDIPLPQGIDYIGFYINEWDNQIIYVRAGKINERIAYVGEEDLREYVDVIINDVLN